MTALELSYMCAYIQTYRHTDIQTYTGDRRLLLTALELSYVCAYIRTYRHTDIYW